MMKCLVGYEMSGKMTYPVNDMHNKIIFTVGDGGVAERRVCLVGPWWKKALPNEAWIEYEGEALPNKAWL